MKTALITGASSGIGLELARVFARHGHNLVLVARSKDKLEALKKELEEKVTVTLIVTDLTKEHAATKIKDILEENHIRIDFLVNNAGFGKYGSFEEVNWEIYKNMIDLNITSLTHLTKVFLHDLIKTKGKILNVASVAGFVPCPNNSVYFASKSYVLLFSEALANELKGKVSVTALCPGATISNFQKIAGINELEKNSNVATSQEVAEYGYKAMMKGKVVAVHGKTNKLMTQVMRFIPRKTAANIAKKVSNSKRGEKNVKRRK